MIEKHDYSQRNSSLGYMTQGRIPWVSTGVNRLKVLTSYQVTILILVGLFICHSYHFIRNIYPK